MQKRAYRNTQDKVLAGVCSGLGEYFSIDPLFIRIVFLLCLFEPPIAIVGYIALWIALPKKPIQMPIIGNGEAQEQSPTTFEQKVEEIQREAEVIGERFEKTAEEFGKNIEHAAEQFEENMKKVINDKKIEVNFKIESKPNKGKAMGFILITLGLIFLAHNFLPHFDIERFWPIILIGIGLSILFSGKKEVQS